MGFYVLTLLGTGLLCYHDHLRPYGVHRQAGPIVRYAPDFRSR